MPTRCEDCGVIIAYPNTHCDDCAYAAEAVMDNLTDKEEHEEIH